MTQKIGKGRLAQVTVTLPIPASATQEEIQEWIAYRLTTLKPVAITNPLSGAKLDPIKVDINVSPNFVEFQAKDMEITTDGKVNFSHVATGHFDRRSLKEINGWKDRNQVFIQERDRLIAERDKS